MTTYESQAATNGYSVTPIRGYESYATFAADIAASSVGQQFAAVRYDNENWVQTPVNEQQDPATYMMQFTQLAHAHGYVVIVTPALDLMGVTAAPCHAQSGELLSDAFLRCGIPAAAATADADVYDIQAQSLQLNTLQYSTFARSAAAQAHAINVDLLVLAGVTTDRAGDTADNMFSSANAVLGLLPPENIAGFWLNSTASDAAQIGIATNFLQQLRAAGY